MPRLGLGIGLGMNRRAASASFDPLALTQVTALWRSDAGTTVSSGTDLATWTDQDSGAIALTANGPVAQLLANQFGTKAGISTNGKGALYGTITTASVSGAPTAYVYAVLILSGITRDSSDPTANDQLWFLPGQFQGVSFRTGGGSPKAVGWQYSLDDFAYHTAEAAVTTGGKVIVTWRIAGGKVGIRVGSGAFTEAAATNPLFNGSTGQLNFNFGGTLNGVLGCLVFCKGDMSADDANMLAWLTSTFSV